MPEVDVIHKLIRVIRAELIAHYPSKWNVKHYRTRLYVVPPSTKHKVVVILFGEHHVTVRISSNGPPTSPAFTNYTRLEYADPDMMQALITTIEQYL